MAVSGLSGAVSRIASLMSSDRSCFVFSSCSLAVVVCWIVCHCSVVISLVACCGSRAASWVLKSCWVSFWFAVCGPFFFPFLGEGSGFSWSCHFWPWNNFASLSVWSGCSSCRNWLRACGSCFRIRSISCVSWNSGLPGNLWV